MQDRAEDPGNVRAAAYLIVVATSQCSNCSRETRVVGLGVGPGHESFDADAEPHDAWQAAGWPALLFHLYSLPEAVLRRLQEVSSEFGPRSSRGTPEWSNHCPYCRHALDEDALHCEPGGAFMPESRAAAGLIRVKSIDAPLWVGAAGYSPAPEFFDCFVPL